MTVNVMPFFVRSSSKAHIHERGHEDDINKAAGTSAERRTETIAASAPPPPPAAAALRDSTMHGFPSDVWLSGSSMASTCITARSSVLSWGWGNDEFERKASSQVQQLFDELDDALYNGRAQNTTVHEQCTEWAKSFPHLRVVGKSQSPELDPGDVQDFDFSASSEHLENLMLPPSHSSILPKGSSKQGINIEGRAVKPVKFSIPNNDEEVIAQDGNYEEFFAVDQSDTSMEHKASSSLLPPVTPVAVAQDTVLAALFDQLWEQIVNRLSGIIRQYYQQLKATESLPEVRQGPEDDLDRTPVPSPEHTSPQAARSHRVSQIKERNEADIVLQKGVPLPSLSNGGLVSEHKNSHGHIMSWTRNTHHLPPLENRQETSTVHATNGAPQSVKPKRASSAQSARRRTSLGEVNRPMSRPSTTHGVRTAPQAVQNGHSTEKHVAAGATARQKLPGLKQSDMKTRNNHGTKSTKRVY